MKCRDVQEWIAGIPGGGEPEAPPEEVRRHLERCGPCGQAAERDRKLRALLRLSRRVQPDPLRETRILARVRDELQGVLPGRNWLDLAGGIVPLPAVRFGLALAALVLIAVVGFRLTGESPDGDPAIARDTPGTRYPDGTPRDAPPILTLRERPLDLLMANTNPALPMGPGADVRYGPGASSPVKFDLAPPDTRPR